MSAPMTLDDLRTAATALLAMDNAQAVLTMYADLLPLLTGSDYQTAVGLQQAAQARYAGTINQLTALGVSVPDPAPQQVLSLAR